MKFEYDLFVIGGGSGGVRAARVDFVAIHHDVQLIVVCVQHRQQVGLEGAIGGRRLPQEGKRMLHVEVALLACSGADLDRLQDGPKGCVRVHGLLSMSLDSPPAAVIR